MPERRIRRKPGENRAHLVQAGLTEFGLYGYHGASTAAIAARADVPQPHVYASFSGKRELFLECLTVALDHVAAGECPCGAHTTCAHEMMVFQAIAASAHPELQSYVPPLLSGIGAQRATLLERAAVALISTAALLGTASQAIQIIPDPDSA